MCSREIGQETKEKTKRANKHMYDVNESIDKQRREEGKGKGDADG